MTSSAERPDDYNEPVNHFLKLHGQEVGLRALQLTRCYGIELQELMSRTEGAVWEKWPTEFLTLSDSERYKRALRIMYNISRNLSKSTRRAERRCDLLPGEELERLTHASIFYQDDPVAVEVIFKDEVFAIYKAVSQLEGRCRDVMTLIILGLADSEIRQELSMAATNLTSTKSRARKLLRVILGLENKDKDEGGAPR